MKIGKLSELVLNRSVLKKITYKRKEVLMGAKVGNDAAVMNIDGNLVTAVAGSSSLAFLSKLEEIKTMENIANEEEIQLLKIKMNAKATAQRALNSVAAAFGKPFAISISQFFPETMTEPQIKQVMDAFAELAKEQKVQIAGGHSEVSSFVTEPVFSVTAYAQSNTPKPTKKPVDIVMCGYMGMEATGFLARLGEEQLKSRFPLSYIRKAAEEFQSLSVVSAALCAAEYGVAAMHDVSTTGIFGALWEFGEQMKCGIEIDWKAIPVKQETIELTEYLDINPFTMLSSGALLIASEDGYGLTAELEAKGIKAAVIGRVTEGKDKVILHGEERRFLEQPR